ncbi:MAG TPA: biopolymer transporter ExbD [Methylomusa anaerophila]|uniref:Biopolymer transport protein ExbD n=1 Tax=Methylomusa anaerophila TaxID=1930071 RepID=A0A348ALM7_9FIRM|nr:biopolymer transporter ExbD [Methylomusa anaerophila]BBB91975.1 biopolymer transport protein ExbD [Methylomusa anaerophila]HML88012.1 biopolymer transporter ExbD [Methylomusa anaerophila]
MSLRKSRHSIGVHLDMTPMVDVMMLLVIFFMMSTTFILTNPGLPINLPKAAAVADQPQNIVVVINRDGQLAVGDRTISLSELRSLLTATAAKQPVVYLKADKEVRHGTVVEVMDEIRKTGISKLSVAVDAKGI